MRPEHLAARTRLAENFILKVMSGDAVVTESVQTQAIADALDMPLPARSALGIAPPSRDPLVMPGDFLGATGGRRVQCHARNAVPDARSGQGNRPEIRRTAP